MMSPLADASGEHTEEPRSVNMKRLLFDWAGVIAIAGGAVGWGTTTSHVESNTREIERLRAANEARAVYDVKMAGEVATKTDVQRLSDQIQALSIEFRARAGK